MQISEIPVHVSHSVVVDPIRPFRKGLMQAVDGTAAHRLERRIRPRRPLDQSRVADGDPPAARRVTGNDRTVMGRRHLHEQIITPDDGNALLEDVGFFPGALEVVLAPSIRALAEALQKQILGIGCAIGHAPGDVLVVTEMQYTRHAGNRGANG